VAANAVSVIPAQDEPACGIAALRALSGAVVPLERWKFAARRRAAVRARAAAAPRPNRVVVSVAGGLSTRLLLVGGKGGVGKTTCAASLALAIARHSAKRRVLLLSTDPAHSIGDVLETPIGDTPRRVPGGPSNLLAREVDAARGWEARLERYRSSVSHMVDAFNAGPHADLAMDRAILDELFSLAPPGMDEITGMLTIIDALFPQPGTSAVDLVIVDTAPTGHALRLLAVPAQAHAWVRQFMKVLLEFEGVTGFGELASELLALSRGLEGLERLLAAPRSCGFVVVTRPERLPVMETARLLDWLHGHNIARRALIVNACTPPGCSRCKRTAARERRETALLVDRAAWARGAVVEADAIVPPPRGVHQLERWSATWRARTRQAASGTR
jgi:arsenite/tail-anchored protein-transporting ATPase